MIPPDVWPGRDGAPITCPDKVAVLRDNHAELAQVVRDAFEDAVLMGVDAEAMRAVLRDVVASLRSPIGERTG